MQKETEVRHNLPLFWKRSLNEGHFGSQEVYLPSPTVVPLSRQSVRSWNRRACPVLCPTRLCHISERSPHCSLSETPLVKGHLIPHSQILFFVCVLFPILLNQSIKPLFCPLFVCAASQTPSLSTSTILSTRGAPIHTGKSGPFNRNQRVINPGLTLHRPAWGWNQTWLESPFRVKTVIICSASFRRTASQSPVQTRTFLGTKPAPETTATATCQVRQDQSSWDLEFKSLLERELPGR